MVIKSGESSLAAWVFLIGIVIAVIIGFSTIILPLHTLVAYNKFLYGILILLGIIIGFISVQGEDTRTFLWAGAVLVIVSKFGMESVMGSLIGIGLGDAVSSVFAAILALLVPATIIVAIKVLFTAAKV